MQVHLLCPKYISVRQNQQWFFSILQARFNFQSGEATSGVVTFMPGLGISFEVYFYNIQLFFNVPFNTKPEKKKKTCQATREVSICAIELAFVISQVHFCKALTSFMKPFQQTSVILMCFHYFFCIQNINEHQSTPRSCS